LVEEQGFLDLAREILGQPAARPDRTGVGTLSVFARQLRFDVSDTVPVLTTRALGVKTIVRELLWFLRGSCDSKELEREGVRIWAGNTSREFLDQRGLAHYAEGETGPLYGWSLRCFGAAYKGSKGEGEDSGCWGMGKAKRKSEHGQGIKGYDQLEELVAGLKNDPFSRRHLMTTFNPGVVDQCVLAPCHGIAIQFYVEKAAGQGEEFQLSCHVYCRSSDTFLGLPFNIASYALLTHMVAQTSGLEVGDFVHSFGDAHLYLNHLEQAQLQLSREIRPLPQLKLNPDVRSVFDFTFEDVAIEGYDPHPLIRAPVAV
jgi:thymidylate synthase